MALFADDCPEACADDDRKGHKEGHLSGDELSYEAGESVQYMYRQTAADGDSGRYPEDIDKQRHEKKISGAQKSHDDANEK